MDSLTLVLGGAAISAVTQLGKKLFPGVHPLLWVALLSSLLGFLWGVFVPMLPEEVMTKMVAGYGTAIAIYETLKQFTNKDV